MDEQLNLARSLFAHDEITPEGYEGFRDMLLDKRLKLMEG